MLYMSERPRAKRGWCSVLLLGSLHVPTGDQAERAIWRDGCIRIDLVTRGAGRPGMAARKAGRRRAGR